MLSELEHVDFLSLFDDFDEGVIITDKTGNIIYYNRAMGHIDDLNPEFTLGKKVTEIYDLTDETSIIMESLINCRTILDRHLFYRTRFGKVANTIHRVFPLIKDEHIRGAICFVKEYNVLEETITSIAIPRKKSKQNNSTSYTFSDLIGENPIFNRAVDTAKMAANSPSPIMLYGETGTGKELLTQSIHNHSIRKNHQYLPVNCAAIPENLLEGILFGTAKGAFTGALDKPGLFERANGGTLFLDEVNAMSINLQAKILRVLQEKRVRRVGSLKELSIDLKIISSVDNEPHQAIEEGALRPDLFYRLGVVFIAVPPLRDRRDDIDRLTRHFLDKHNRALGKKIPVVSREVMDIFRRYEWPGNVRELEHVIESAMNIARPNDIIDINHIQGHASSKFKELGHFYASNDRRNNPKDRRRIPQEKTSGLFHPGTVQSKPGNLVKLQAEREETAIKNALSHYTGNISRAAESIGISRQLLYYKMKKYRLNREDFI